MELPYTILEKDEGRILKYVLRDRLRLSATLLRRIKNDGAILLNGEPVFATARLRAGDRLLLRFPPEEADFPPEPGPLHVLWEDALYLAPEKPAGLLTHPSHSRYTGTLANFALSYVRAWGGESVHAVNRLDRDTSGVVLFSKNAWGKSLLREAEMEKRYLALVFGAPPEETGLAELPIRRAAEREQRRIVAPDGAAARTRWRVLRRFEAAGGAYSLVLLRLETGRTHQIRVHMAALGCPLLGDRLYGTPASAALSAALGVERQALHACLLRFTHPLTGEAVELRSLPEWKALTGVDAEEIFQSEI